LRQNLAGYASSNNGNSAGVYGEDDTASAQGVYGYGANGIGVWGNSNNLGVYATGTYGLGAQTYSPAGIAVKGEQLDHSNTGYAGSTRTPAATSITPSTQPCPAQAPGLDISTAIST
jgi:hypothetical protein